MNDVTRKSDAWIATHRATIGGSNAAAAVGINPYKSPASLFYEMVNGTAQDLSTNPDVLRGLLLEPVARQRLSEVFNLDVIEHDQNEFIRNEKYPHSHALPDGWILWDGERIPLEIKVPAPRNWERLDIEIPDHIQCQAIHNAAVIGAPALLLVCLNPVSMEIYRNIFEAVPDAVDALMEGEERFWNEHIVPRIPPEPRSHEDLKLRWPQHEDGKRIKTTPEIEAAHSWMMKYRREAKEANDQAEKMSFEIRAFMADCEALIDDDTGRVLATYKSSTRSTLDAKRLKIEAPVIYSSYLKSAPVRVFLPKRASGSDR